MKHNLKLAPAIVVLFLAALLALPAQAAEEDEMPAAIRVTKAVCVLHPVGGSNVHGVVTFTDTADGIRVVADIEGLTPGDHGFHIHQYGDCSALDATSAGGHFNPGSEPHGGPNDIQRHVGDLGNVTADASGHAHYSRVDHHIAFHGPDSIIGRAVIVHAGKDDFKTQPTGNAGKRIACGVIGIAKP